MLQYMLSSTHRAACLLSAFVVLALAPATARAQSAGEEPTKRITIYLPVTPGGSFDHYARLLSRFMGKHLPGNPTIIVSHMPGGGGVVMLNRLYVIAAKDGSELGMPQRTNPTESVLRETSQAKYEADKFAWIGSMNREIGVLQFWQSPPVSLQEVLSGREFHVGATGATSDSATFYRVINRLLGTNLKTIPAYGGAVETLVAMEKGELAGTAAVSYATTMRSRPDWFATGKSKIMMQMTLDRSKQLPDVPSLKELIKGDLDRQVIDLILSCQDLGRPLLAPPGVPADRIAMLRTAFERTVRDPDALEEAAKMKIDIDPIFGPEAQDMIARMVATPKPIVQRARQIFAE